MALNVVFVSGLTLAMARDELTETIFPQRGCWITPYLNLKLIQCHELQCQKVYGVWGFNQVFIPARFLNRYCFSSDPTYTRTLNQ